MCQRYWRYQYVDCTDTLLDFCCPGVCLSGNLQNTGAWVKPAQKGERLQQDCTEVKVLHNVPEAAQSSLWFHFKFELCRGTKRMSNLLNLVSSTVAECFQAGAVFVSSSGYMSESVCDRTIGPTWINMHHTLFLWGFLWFVLLSHSVIQLRDTLTHVQVK